MRSGIPFRAEVRDLRRRPEYRNFKRPFRPLWAVAGGPKAAQPSVSLGLAVIWGVIAERLGGLMGVRQRRSRRFPAGY